MQVTATPAPKSLGRCSRSSSRRSASTAPSTKPSGTSSRRTRVPGFRPGKAPRPVLERVLGPGAVLDEAVEHLVQDAYREALIEQDDPAADERRRRGRPGRGGQAARSSRRRSRSAPRSTLGDYSSFNFGPEIETIDDARVDKVVEELRDQNATLAAGRGPRRQERRLRGHRVRRHARRRRRSRAAPPSGCR